jgi:hypothetical protein
LWRSGLWGLSREGFAAALPCRRKSQTLYQDSTIGTDHRFAAEARMRARAVARNRARIKSRSNRTGINGGSANARPLAGPSSRKRLRSRGPDFSRPPPASAHPHRRFAIDGPLDGEARSSRYSRSRTRRVLKPPPRPLARRSSAEGGAPRHYCGITVTVYLTPKCRPRPRIAQLPWADLGDRGLRKGFDSSFLLPSATRGPARRSPDRPPEAGLSIDENRQFLAEGPRLCYCFSEFGRSTTRVFRDHDGGLALDAAEVTR